jgi:hypothetical protein
MTYKLTLASIAIQAVSIGLAQTNVSIDTASRTVTTNNFVVTWNTGVDTEAVTSLAWMGGSNLVSYNELNTCGDVNNDDEYSGNAEAPPYPSSPGKVLVGAGTITPAGTVAWSGIVLSIGTDQVTINSNSTNCPPTSAGVNVQTTYRFPNPRNPAANWFQVQRVFDFSAAPFAYDVRPYLPRFGLSDYTEVLYPSTGGVLAVTNVSSCPGGCTGPHSAPGAAPLSPAWASSQGWFAIHDPSTQQGVVVKRAQSADPQDDPIAAQLWIDNDLGSYTNASSFLLMSPAGGFNGGLVTEVETLCFYNSTLWTPSLIPPAACINAPLTVFPGSLTYPSQSVNSTSATQTVIVKNSGNVAVTIGGIVASGDFYQQNNCPASLAAGAYCSAAVIFKPSATGIRSGSVSVVDALSNSPQTVGLAGLGVPTT